MTFEKEFLLKSAWQEYMPDVYALDDSTLLMVGLNTNMTSLSMNFFMRWMTLDGEIIVEKEIVNRNNPDAHSFQLDSYYDGSAIDDEYIYALAYTETNSCNLSGEMVRAHRLVKVRISDGFIEKDTILCFDGIRVFSEISTSAQEDTLYLYGSMGYLNRTPDIILTTMTKDFQYVHHQKLRTIDTNVLPLGIEGDSRAVAGSHYRHVYYDLPHHQDIWFGRIEADTIIETYRMEYFTGHVLWKSFVLDADEKAFLGFSFGAWYGESSIYLLRGDTLAWNFYDAFNQELSDIIKIDSSYCILQTSFRARDYLKFEIILHYVDNDGFPYGSDTFIVPWMRYVIRGFKFQESYYVFIKCTDNEVPGAVSNGEILLEEARWDYTHVFKFRINE